MSSKSYYVGPKVNDKFRMSGWFNESYRHMLASKGVKTGRKSKRPPQVLPIYRREAVKPYPPKVKDKYKKERVLLRPPKVLPKYAKEEPFKLFAEKDMPVHEALGLTTKPEKIKAIKELESMEPVTGSMKEIPKSRPKPKVKEFKGLGYEISRPFAYLGETGKRLWEGTEGEEEGVFVHPEATKSRILGWERSALRKRQEREELMKPLAEIKKKKELVGALDEELAREQRAERIKRLKEEKDLQARQLADIKEAVKSW